MSDLLQGIARGLYRATRFVPVARNFEMRHGGQADKLLTKATGFKDHAARLRFYATGIHFANLTIRHIETRVFERYIPFDNLKALKTGLTTFANVPLAEKVSTEAVSAFSGGNITYARQVDLFFLGKIKPVFLKILKFDGAFALQIRVSGESKPESDLAVRLSKERGFVRGRIVVGINSASPAASYENILRKLDGLLGTESISGQQVADHFTGQCDGDYILGIVDDKFAVTIAHYKGERFRNEGPVYSITIQSRNAKGLSEYPIFDPATKAAAVALTNRISDALKQA